MTPVFSLNQVKASVARSLFEANAQGRDNAVVVKVFDDLDLLAGTAIPSYNLTPCDTGVAHDHNTIDATIDAGELPVASEELSVTKKRGVCRRFARFGTCKFGCNCYFSESHGDVIAEVSSTSTNTSDDEEPTYTRDALDFCFAAWRRQTMLQSPAPLRTTTHRMDGLDTQTLPLVPDFPPHLADSCAAFYIGDVPEIGGSDFPWVADTTAMDKHVTFGQPEHEECSLSVSDEENDLFGERSSETPREEKDLFEHNRGNACCLGIGDESDNILEQKSILRHLESLENSVLPSMEVRSYSLVPAGFCVQVHDGIFTRPCLVLQTSELFTAFSTHMHLNMISITKFSTRIINGKNFVFLEAGNVFFRRPAKGLLLSSAWGQSCNCSKCGARAMLEPLTTSTE